MTAALEGGEWSAARPGRTLPPGKTQYLLYRRLGGPHGLSGQAEYLVPTGIRSRAVQPVVSRYTDWATRHTHTHIRIYIPPAFKNRTDAYHMLIRSIKYFLDDADGSWVRALCWEVSTALEGIWNAGKLLHFVQVSGNLCVCVCVDRVIRRSH